MSSQGQKFLVCYPDTFIQDPLGTALGGGPQHLSSFMNLFVLRISGFLFNSPNF